MAGDIFDCYYTGVATGIWWAEIRAAAEHPKVQRTVPATKSQ